MRGSSAPLQFLVVLNLVTRFSLQFLPSDAGTRMPQIPLIVTLVIHRKGCLNNVNTRSGKFGKFESRKLDIEVVYCAARQSASLL